MSVAPSGNASALPAGPADSQDGSEAEGGCTYSAEVVGLATGLALSLFLNLVLAALLCIRPQPAAPHSGTLDERLFSEVSSEYALRNPLYMFRAGGGASLSGKGVPSVSASGMHGSIE